MTDRSNDAPGDDLEPRSDLTDAELAKANDDAEFEVEVQEAGDDFVFDAEEEAAAQAAVAEEAAADRMLPTRPGARARAEAASRERAAGGSRTPRPPKATRTAFPIDPSLRIKDPVSTYFVIGSIVVFLLIFLGAMAFGHGGAFTSIPTPTPYVSPSPAPSVSPGPSGSVAPSGSPAASQAASPGASGAASPAPSTAPSAPAGSTAPTSS